MPAQSGEKRLFRGLNVDVGQSLGDAEASQSALLGRHDRGADIRFECDSDLLLKNEFQGACFHQTNG